MQSFSKFIQGLLILIIGCGAALFGFYWAGWHFCILSIVDFVNQCKKTNVDAVPIAIDIACFICTFPLFWFSLGVFSTSFGTACYKLYRAFHKESPHERLARQITDSLMNRINPR